MTNNNNLSNSISLSSDSTTSEDMNVIQSKFNKFNKSQEKKIQQEPSFSDKRDYCIEEGKRFQMQNIFPE